MKQFVYDGVEIGKVEILDKKHLLKVNIIKTLIYCAWVAITYATVCGISWYFILGASFNWWLLLPVGFLHGVLNKVGFKLFA
jgi:hypothetical protein